MIGHESEHSKLFTNRLDDDSFLCCGEIHFANLLLKVRAGITYEDLCHFCTTDSQNYKETPVPCPSCKMAGTLDPLEFEAPSACLFGVTARLSR